MSINSLSEAVANTYIETSVETSFYLLWGPEGRIKDFKDELEFEVETIERTGNVVNVTAFGEDGAELEVVITVEARYV